jgi:pyruvate/2-oxoacid:ferredoxin oxidoreductase alpha subunit
MEWPFPIAVTQPSAASESSEIVSSVEAYASTDRTFAMDFEDDEYLQQVLHDLNEGIDRDKLAFQIAKQAIVPVFLTRADFAAEQALVVRLKMREAVRKNDKNYLLSVKADIDDVENEVKHTLEVLQSFQRILSPRLDLSVDTLRGVQEHVKLSEPTEEDYLSETDDDESTMAYKED